MSRKYTVGRRNSSCLFPTKKCDSYHTIERNPSLFEDCILGWVAKDQKRKENLSFIIERTNRNAVRGGGDTTMQLQ